MTHQYGSSKKINTAVDDIAELQTRVAAFVDFTETGASTATLAAGLAAVIASLIEAGLMEAA